MQRPATSTRLVAFTAALAFGTAACSGGTPITLPDADDLPAPTFTEPPSDLADSSQLDAIVARDTAGIDASIDGVSAELLAPALAAYLALPDAQTELTRLSIYDDSVDFSYYERGIAGRSVTAFYRLPYEGDTDEEPTISVTEPTFAERPTFSITGLDPDVPARIAAALEQRFPLADVESIDAEITTAYGGQAVWNISLYDARGEFAEVIADFGGAIVSVSSY